MQYNPHRPLQKPRSCDRDHWFETRRFHTSQWSFPQPPGVPGRIIKQGSSLDDPLVIRPSSKFFRGPFISDQDPQPWKQGAATSGQKPVKKLTCLSDQRSSSALFQATSQSVQVQSRLMEDLGDDHVKDTPLIGVLRAAKRKLMSDKFRSSSTGTGGFGDDLETAWLMFQDFSRINPASIINEQLKACLNVSRPR